MQIMIVVVLNIFFILFVYRVFSKRIAVLESKRLPENVEKEMNELLTTFNQTADRNIDLLDDRLDRLKPISEKAEKQILLLEGLLKKYELLKVSKPVFVSKKEAGKVQPSITGGIAAKLYQNSVLMDENALESKPAKKKAIRSQRKKSVKSINQKISQFSKKNLSPEEIAAKLGISTEEVLFKLKLFPLSKKS
ncbi:MAG: hypothetical protein KAR07_05815 [Spirochaetes bacterium]|nr:hypothetical protein [Spirochaetota bacterium]MCK5267661.1 hypothetical protein [Spirochaetota bacterium]